MKFFKNIHNNLTHVQVIAMGYLAVILLGTLLLLLPFSTRTGQSTDFLTALYTAASATCVIGFVLVDTAMHWTLFGQLVILLMIQIGGLGFMTMGILLAMILKKRITLRARGLLQESMNYMQMGGVVRLVRTALFGTLLFEGVGAVLLAVRFVPLFGFWKGTYYSIFHSISAFCNAGFELMGSYSGEYSSLTAFSGDVLVNITVIILTVAGGIGFFVWTDLRQNKLHFKKYMLHTKIAISTSLILLVGGMVFYLLFEWDNLLAGMSVGDKILAAAFSSANARTTGFNTVDPGSMTSASKLLTMVLMFIGGSPGSTAGGIKTVTLTVLIVYVWSNLRGSSGINIFNRRLEGETVRKASNVVMISLLMAIGAAGFICFMQPELPLEDVLFEVVAAIGTTGLSTGLTREITGLSRAVMLVLMYCGRIGSMSFALSLMEKKKAPPVKLPAEKIMIG
ncbi:MAG: Trk family potassium uptake protein [Lachnospiraceae bacterium]|nr:Trk family potassium uptake protein [Lachnospiraceae bacterium]MBQ8597578.1 Trk family potassium uptake protein [Lachnospiraceae bacterium]